VHGAAAGGAVGLALACDFVIASEDASFVPAYTKLGTGPDGTTCAIFSFGHSARSRGGSCSKESAEILGTSDQTIYNDRAVSKNLDDEDDLPLLSPMSKAE
jgi:enoyl-CoA hydratase/carnithine racemase